MKFALAALALSATCTIPAYAQVACPAGLTQGSMQIELVKVERQGGQLAITYLLKSNYNTPTDIHPYHWGHDKHVIRDSNGYTWEYKRHTGPKPNFRMETGDLQRVTMNFLLREGDPTASTFNIDLNFMAIPSGGGIRLGQSRMSRWRWTNVPVSCVTQR